MKRKRKQTAPNEATTRTAKEMTVSDHERIAAA